MRLRMAKSALSHLFSPSLTFSQGGGSSSTFGSICPYELILCDVELPGIPGVEVLNQLRATLRTEVSIIMLASDMTGQVGTHYAVTRARPVSHPLSPHLTPFSRCHAPILFI